MWGHLVRDAMTSYAEMTECPLTGDTHIWVFAPPTEGIHPADGNTYAWLGAQCNCGMKLLMEKAVNTGEIDVRELT